jgi:hypothetical protein
VIAASYYVRAWPLLADAYVYAPFTAMGRFFEVDRGHVACWPR